MGRVLALAYGVVCYLIFFGTFLCAIWFVGTMDKPAETDVALGTVLFNAALLGLFAVQHSVMARQWFKRAWTKIGPHPVERSTYVLAASLALLILIRFWQFNTLPAEMTSDHAEEIRDVMRVLGEDTKIFFPTNGGREALHFYLRASLNKFLGVEL